MKKLFTILFVATFCARLLAPVGYDVLLIPAGEAIYDRSVLNLCNVLYEIERAGIKEPGKVLAQCRLETGDLSSNISKRCNNLFGMKYPRRRETKATGRYKSMAVYNTWQDSIEDYRIWQDAFYKGGDYYEFLRGRYATDKKYIEKLKAL